MQTPDALNAVADFHRTFHHPIEPEPVIPAPDRCRLRLTLLQEELDELAAAVADKDLLEVADALCDLQYVLAGAILEFGLGEKFKALFDEVQRSNMSKACDSREEAQATVDYYRRERGEEAYIVEQLPHWLVYRRADNKTLKSVNYAPADLRAILNG